MRNRFFILCVIQLTFLLISLRVQSQITWERIYGGTLNGEFLTGLDSGGANWTMSTTVDIDDDGDYDFFIGRDDGTIIHYRNDGSSTSPAWTFVSENYASISVDGGSSPVFVDIDRDQDFDLISGNNSNNIAFYRNSGSPDSPSWEFVTSNYGNIQVGWGTKPGLFNSNRKTDKWRS